VKRAAILAAIALLAGCGTRPEAMKPEAMRTKSEPRPSISAIDTKTPANKFVVKSNESAQDIADRFHVSLEDLLRENPGLFRDIVQNPAQGGKPTGAPAGGQTAAPSGDPNAPLPNDREVTLPSKESMAGFELEVLRLTNAEREKAGLKPCAGDDTNLNRSARAKSEDMAANNYFSHDSPTYGDPFAMMRNFGVQYQSAGENIAKGQPTPGEVVQAWMNSPGHRENILNGSYTHLGVGYVANNGQPCWTQQFISK